MILLVLIAGAAYIALALIGICATVSAINSMYN